MASRPTVSVLPQAMTIDYATRRPEDLQANIRIALEYHVSCKQVYCSSVKAP